VLKRNVSFPSWQEELREHASELAWPVELAKRHENHCRLCHTGP